MTEAPFYVVESSQLAKGNRINAGRLGLYEDRLIYVSQPQFLRTVRQDIRYDQIAQVHQEHGAKFTSLVIETTGGDRVVMPGMDAADVQKAITLIEERTARTGGGEPAPVLDVADEIRKLAEIRDLGILTDEEFSARKKKLLDL